MSARARDSSTSSSGPAGSRWPWALLVVGLIVSVVAGASAVTVDRELATRGEVRLEREYLMAVAADLRRDREALDRAADSVSIQLRAVDQLLEYAAGSTALGSGLVIRLLDEVREPARPALTRETYRDLVFTGQGAVIRPRVREKVVGYYLRSGALGPGSSDELLAYDRFLDAHLSRGGWEYLHGLYVAGEDPLGFLDEIRRLREAGLEGALRGVRRAYARYDAELTTLRESNQALIARLETTLDDRPEPRPGGDP